MNSFQSSGHWVAIVLTILIGSASSSAQTPQPVKGFVDLHSHPMAEHAFGGSWFWGNLEGSEDDAVPRCDGNFLTRSHAATRWPVLSELDGFIDFSYDTGWHLGKRRGYDKRRCVKIFGIAVPGTCPRTHYKHWPHWQAIAHQQMWEGWIRQAHQGGMQVTVASLVESNFLCINTPPLKRRYPSCNEMDSVIRQAEEANAFVARNSDWVGIAWNAAEARHLISQGKLALVLAVEVTKLFPTGDYIQQLEQLYSLGVRSIQLSHHADSRFTGAAPLPKLIKTVEEIESFLGILLGNPFSSNVSDINDIICRNQFGQAGDCDGANYLNELGLTADGLKLVQTMMDRGMLLDVAHTSRTAFAEVYAEAMANNGYPLMYSHTHLWDTIRKDGDETHHEKYLQEAEFSMIRDTGGMIGLRTGSEPTHHYHEPVVPGGCQGSGRSFGQSLMYAIDNGLSVGFGADFNGFIKQARHCPEVASSTQLREKGLAHVGLLPALIQDLKNSGVDPTYLDHLDNSAEVFLQMWERAESLATIPPTSSCNQVWNHKYVGNYATSEKVAGDIAINRPDTQLFYRGETGYINHFYWSPNNPGDGWANTGLVYDWQNQHPNLRVAVGSPIEISDSGQVFYKGQDGRMQTYYYSQTNGWRHGYVGHHAPSEKVAGDIAINRPDGQLFYRGETGYLNHFYWSPNNPGDGWSNTGLVDGWGNQPDEFKVATNSPIEISDSGQVFYKGQDGRMQTYYYSQANGWRHGHVGHHAPSEKVAGDIAINRPDGQLFYRGETGYLNHFYWSPNNPGDGWTNTGLVDGWGNQPNEFKVAANSPIEISDSGQVFYKGQDGRMQTYYYNQPDGWRHGHVGHHAPSEKVAGDIAISRPDAQLFYRGETGYLNHFYWSPNNPGDGWTNTGLVDNWWGQNSEFKVAANSPIEINNSGQVFYKGNDGKMQTYHWGCTY